MIFSSFPWEVDTDNDYYHRSQSVITFNHTRILNEKWKYSNINTRRIVRMAFEKTHHQNANLVWRLFVFIWLLLLLVAAISAENYRCISVDTLHARTIYRHDLRAVMPMSFCNVWSACSFVGLMVTHCQYHITPCIHCTSNVTTSTHTKALAFVSA